MVNILPKWDIGIISNSGSALLIVSVTVRWGQGREVCATSQCQEHDPTPVQNRTNSNLLSTFTCIIS